MAVSAFGPYDSTDPDGADSGGRMGRREVGSACCLPTRCYLDIKSYDFRPDARGKGSGEEEGKVDCAFHYYSCQGAST